MYQEEEEGKVKDEGGRKKIGEREDKEKRAKKDDYDKIASFCQRPRFLSY